MLTNIALVMQLLLPSHKPQPIPYYPVPRINELVMELSAGATAVDVMHSGIDRGFNLPVSPAFVSPVDDPNSRLPIEDHVEQDPNFSALPLVGQCFDPFTDEPTDFGLRRPSGIKPFNPVPPFNPIPYVNDPWA